MTPLQHEIFNLIEKRKLNNNQKKQILELFVNYAKKNNLVKNKNYYITKKNTNKEKIIDLSFCVDDIIEEKDETLLAILLIIENNNNNQ